MAVPLETVLRLDDREFNARLQAVEGRSNIFARRFSGGFVSGISRLFAPTAIANFLRNVIASREEIVGLGEDANTSLANIEKGWRAIANAVKLTVAQIIAGNIDGKSPGERKGLWSRWIVPAMNAIIQRDTGGLQKLGENFGSDVSGADQAKAAQQQSKQAREAQAKQIKEMEELATKLKDENLLAGLSVDARRKEIAARLEALKDPSKIQGMSQVGILENMIQREQLQSQLMGLSKIGVGNLQKPKFGALSEVGGFLGRTDNMRLVKIQDESVRQLMKIERNTAPLLTAQPLGL